MVGDISTDDGVKKCGRATEISGQVGFDEGDVAEIVAAYALGSGVGPTHQRYDVGRPWPKRNCCWGQGEAPWVWCPFSFSRRIP